LEALKGRDSLFLHISTALHIVLLADCSTSCSVELVRNLVKYSGVALFSSKFATTDSESFTESIQEVHAGRF